MPSNLISPPAELTRLLVKLYQLPEEADWSEEILIYLCLAIYSAEQLQKEVPLKLDNKDIILNTLQRAWYETTQLRVKSPNTLLVEKSSRKDFGITRFGNLTKKN